MVNKSAHARNTETGTIRIVLALVITAVASALMLSVVNLITEGKIEANRRNELISAMTAIFPEMTDYETLDGEFGGDVSTVYRTDGGYCVITSPKGFAGKIEMMIGITSDGSVAGIRILDSSETPGIGTKIEGEYLDSFKGRTGNLMLGANVDAVSGATYSSAAVVDGVNSAIAAVKAINASEPETEAADPDDVIDENTPGYVEPPNTEAPEETTVNEITTEAAE